VPRLRLYRLAVALAAGVALLTSTSSPASARGTASGSVTCSFSATVTFSPPLTARGGGTKRSRVRATLSTCSTSGIGRNVAPNIGGATFAGSFAHSPLDCPTLSTTGASASITVRWSQAYGYNQATGKWKKAGLTPSKLSGNTTSGSFAGAGNLTVNVPPTLASRCAVPGGVRSATIAGTITLGPPGGSLTFYPIGGGGCSASTSLAGAYEPTSIAAGPDGALWFTDHGDGTIGRITTSGTVTTHWRLRAQGHHGWS
jgi:hypothetical protein